MGQNNRGQHTSSLCVNVRIDVVWNKDSIASACCPCWGNLPPFSVARTGSSIWSNHFLSVPLKIVPLSEKMSVKKLGAWPLEFIRASPSTPAAQEHKLVFRLLSISFSESFLFLRDHGDPGRGAEHPANINCVGKGIENLAAREHCGDTVKEMSDHRKMDIHPNKGTSIQLLGWRVHIDRSFSYETCDPLTALTHCHTQHVLKRLQDQCWRAVL